jgi:hypothetical protein
MDTQTLEVQREYPVTIDDRKQLAVKLFNQLRAASDSLDGYSIVKTVIQQKAEPHERIYIEPIAKHEPDAEKAAYRVRFVALEKAEKDWTFLICTVLLAFDEAGNVTVAA